MSRYLTQVKKIEFQKRLLFLGTGGAGLLFILLSSPILGFSLLGLGAYLGVKWFQFRAKNGMRF